ncbi:uncharacterized protein COLE_00925 [Cutaneotrichosporon oleaginosum]|uniref:uncharacterized protein n=1 Tax=Cutaneotrichosporon oleaginosum TaxID=879819 RepID=UPI0013229E0E|nr:hypothetical protein COLE_00925 [Cutaneotrichosporon oleaginosum]
MPQDRPLHLRVHRIASLRCPSFADETAAHWCRSPSRWGARPTQRGAAGRVPVP